MKKLMKITVVLALNFLALSFTVTNHYSDSTELKGSRAPASATESARKSWAFQYKDLAKKPFQIKKEASSYEEAYKSASRECFQQLTGGKYPGEEKGLDIIDICANPKI